VFPSRERKHRVAPNTTEGSHKTPHIEESEKKPGTEGAPLPDLSAMVAQAKVTLSKTFPPGVDEIRFGRYVLRALPSAHDSSEAVLQFNNAPDEKGSSHPQAEAAFVCQLLSLFI
jgi:hypothetical protein